MDDDQFRNLFANDENGEEEEYEEGEFEDDEETMPSQGADMMASMFAGLHAFYNNMAQQGQQAEAQQVSKKNRFSPYSFDQKELFSNKLAGKLNCDLFFAYFCSS